MKRGRFSMPNVASIPKLTRRFISTSTINNPFEVLFGKFKMDMENGTKNDTMNRIKFVGRLRYTVGNSSKIYKLLWQDLKVNSSIDDVHTYLLKYFGILRKEIVDGMLKHTIEEMGCRVCTYEALGSTALTSDYDINLTSDLPYINNRSIGIFNEKFYSIFGKTSDEVFDTNIYGIGFLPLSKKVMPSNKDYENQMIFAFAKLSMVEKKTNMQLFDRFQPLAKYSSYYKASKKIIPVGDKYTSLLSNIQDYIGNGVTLSRFVNNNSDDKLYTLKDMISTANMYANETYFTQGAFLHVVGSIQGNLDPGKISKIDYILSCIENLFDIVKEYAIYSDNATPAKFLLYSYKYVYRFYHAAYMAGLHSNVKLLDLFEKLDNTRKLKNNEKMLGVLQRELDIELGLIETCVKDIPARRPSASLRVPSMGKIKKSTSMPSNLCGSPHAYMVAYMQLFDKFDIPIGVSNKNHKKVVNILSKISEMVD